MRVKERSSMHPVMQGVNSQNNYNNEITEETNTNASQIEPILVANIQIGQSNKQTARLVIYDTHDISEVVTKFCL